MPSVLLYALDADLAALLDRLNADPEIAFIVADGAGRWRAVDRLDRLPAGHYALWHIPSGSLPLLEVSETEPDRVIDDPFAGWEELRPAAIPGQPFFGSHPGVIWLHVGEEATAKPGQVPMTAVGWIGNRYRAIGKGAAPATERWWRAFQRWIRGRTVWVPRGGLETDSPADVAALPSALAQLRAGAMAAMNPPVS